MDALWGSVRDGYIRKARISGAEPTLFKLHLLAVLPLIEESQFESFMLETNGIVVSINADYAHQLSQFEKVHVRVNLNAATPKGFQTRTGACGETVVLPFKAIEHWLQANANFHVAAMTDSQLMPTEERELLIARLDELDVRLVEKLEEEWCDPYKSTIRRLNAVGVDVDAFFQKTREDD